MLEERAARVIKCVVWDLDNTLWDGVLVEDGVVTVHPLIPDILRTLDSRGILHSIASRNDYTLAWDKVCALALDSYFLYPQIHWRSKVESLQAIARHLNLGLDAIAFIDDQAFERDEVAFTLPDVLTLDITVLPELLAMPAFSPRVVTQDAQRRRQMYQSDRTRRAAEDAFTGSPTAFLASLNMVLHIRPVQAMDLHRAEELTLRTHQLNTTGYSYSYEALDHFRTSPHHRLLVAELEDCYGAYGIIGLTLLACEADVWTIKLLLMSCRVMSRGIGSILITYLLQLAHRHHVRLQAEFIPNDRNRMMLVTYKFAGFRELDSRHDVMILENPLTDLPAYPPYMRVRVGADLPPG